MKSGAGGPTHSWDSWDALRTFHAVAKHGGFAAAGRALGISQSTVSRHIAELEGKGAPLFSRLRAGELTERGAGLLAVVEPMAAAASGVSLALSSSELDAEVTLTTVGELVRWVLAAQLPSLFRAHPRLRLTIHASNENQSLAADEADVALRMERPPKGDLFAKKLATESFALFASSSLPLNDETPWLGFSGSLARVPEARVAVRAFAGRPPRLLVPDIDSLGLAVEAGVGMAVLPRLYATRLKDVVEVSPRAVSVGPLTPRSLYFVVHRKKRDWPKIRAVADWLGRVFAGRT